MPREHYGRAKRKKEHDSGSSASFAVRHSSRKISLKLPALSVAEIGAPGRYLRLLTSKGLNEREQRANTDPTTVDSQGELVL